MRLKFSFTPGSCKKTTFIVQPFRFNDKGTFQFGF